MNVFLTPELANLIQQKIASGRYRSASEVIREAPQLMEEHDRLVEMKLDEMRNFVAVGIEQADRDELFDGPAVFEELHDKLRG